jgi:cysteine desulfurase
VTDLIYLDFNATTPLDPVALEGMLRWFTGQFWNPASSHRGGRLAAAAVETARDQVARLVGARPSEVVWTSGATEANNLALKGVVEGSKGSRRRVVTFATEHKAVLDAVEWLAAQGVPVTVLPVQPDGSLPLDRLRTELARGDVMLVSAMAANNETGVLADLAALAEAVHQAGALLHSDATQAVGRIPFDVVASQVDLASMSAHKLYGPKGVGALFISRRITIEPMIHGGGHERGRRSGTLNVPGIVGFGLAAELASRVLDHEPARQTALVDRFVEALRSRLPGVEMTTDHPDRLPNTISLRIVGAEAEAVMANAPEVAVSAGSACTALVPTQSHVLKAMGLSNQDASECLRISVGRTTTEEDVISGARLLAAAATRVRALAAGSAALPQDPQGVPLS